MANNRLNKTIAGYHILMILSAVDFRFVIEEEIIIKEFMLHEFPFQLNLDKQMEVISNLLPTEWEAHFRACLDDFYDDATEVERTQFIKFALELAKADDIITKEENKFLEILFDTWLPEDK